jgi:soluble lytic murein transglycosylase-like protein
MITAFYMVLLCLFSIPVQAESESIKIYKYIDTNGVLHLTNKPPQKKDTLLYSYSYAMAAYPPPPPQPIVLSNTATKALTLPSPVRPRSSYTDLIEATALRTGLSAALLHSVIKVESAFNPNAVSPKGAQGLMQLMPGTAKRYGVDDPSDPGMNIEGGARYLRDLLEMFNQDVALALAAYNAGENAVKRYGNKIPPYRETQDYVQRVLNIYQSLN